MESTMNMLSSSLHWNQESDAATRNLNLLASYALMH
uniref:Uncharacterized protein n=1 Tax=Arundo donax TaxID=35708 RepID=A0A0A8ZGV3_ARUDO